jgi:hypothetical protein
VVASASSPPGELQLFQLPSDCRLGILGSIPIALSIPIPVTGVLTIRD